MISMSSNDKCDEENERSKGKEIALAGYYYPPMSRLKSPSAWPCPSEGQNAAQSTAGEEPASLIRKPAQVA